MPASAFVLVHPEIFPSNDWDVDDDAYAAAVVAASEGLTRVVVLDDCGLDDLDGNGYFQSGVDPADWQVLEADPFRLRADQTDYRAVLGDCRVVHVGGYHRDDCVRRVVAALVSLGYDARVHEPTALPFPTDENYAR